MKMTHSSRQPSVSTRRSARLSWVITAAFVIAVASAGTPLSADELEWVFDPVDQVDVTNPPLPPYPIQMILDDDTPDGVFGVGFQTAQQFLWFNRFANPGSFQLEEIWVLFPSGANMVVGAQIELVVYLDPDGDPTTGADLLATSTETIQSVDGDTFSVFPLASPLTIETGGDILVGVVDRFVTSGVTSATTPAAMDTTASQGRSWLAVWTGDPPSPPLLPPDGVFSLVDVYQPGNWMIRAFGTPYEAAAVPVLDWRGVALLILLMAAVGWLATRSGR